jgi:hypothetical protein
MIAYNIPKTITQHARDKNSLIVNQGLRLLEESRAVSPGSGGLGDDGLKLSDNWHHLVSFSQVYPSVDHLLLQIT